MRRLVCVLWFAGTSSLAAQQIALDELGTAPWLDYEGIVRAQLTAYERSSQREAFRSLLSGSFTMRFAGEFQLPLSFVWSNKQFSAPSPFTFNRLSLQPSWKKIRAYVGQSSMSFSPYTLQGHQFSGVGIAMPLGKTWEVQALYGRFRKATLTDPELPGVSGSYRRTGWGVSLNRKAATWQWKAHVFSAKDDVASLNNPPGPDPAQLPASNLVLGADTRFQILKNLSAEVNLGFSGMQSNLLLQQGSDLGLLLGTEKSPSYDTHKAVKAQLSYQGKQWGCLLGYERVDPMYQTFGAYFFNNDLEHWRLQLNGSALQSRLRWQGEGGWQRDDLDRDNRHHNNRFVGTFRIQYADNSRWEASLGYSSLQMTTRERLPVPQIGVAAVEWGADSLSLRQINEQADFQLTRHLIKSSSSTSLRTISLTGNLQRSRELSDTLQPGVFMQSLLAYRVSAGNDRGSYTLGVNFLKSADAQDLPANVGPMLTYTQPFWAGKIRSSFRANANYILDAEEAAGKAFYNLGVQTSLQLPPSHQASLSVHAQLRPDFQPEITAVLQYVYRLGNLKLPPLPKFPSSKNPKARKDYLRFTFRDIQYRGTPDEIVQQIDSVQQTLKLSSLPMARSDSLSEMRQALLPTTETGSFKREALIYLSEVYQYTDFLSAYSQWLERLQAELRADMQRADYALERRYTELHGRLSVNKATVDEVLEAKWRLLGHRWMQEEIIQAVKGQPSFTWQRILSEFAFKHWDSCFEKFVKQVNPTEIRQGLESLLINHMYTASRVFTQTAEVVLRYQKISH